MSTSPRTVTGHLVRLSKTRTASGARMPGWVRAAARTATARPPEEAIDDLREAIRMVIEEDGVPEQLERTLDLEGSRGCLALRCLQLQVPS
jgi:hypothetical protein